LDDLLGEIALLVVELRVLHGDEAPSKQAQHHGREEDGRQVVVAEEYVFRPQLQAGANDTKETAHGADLLADHARKQRNLAKALATDAGAPLVIGVEGCNLDAAHLVPPGEMLGARFAAVDMMRSEAFPKEDHARERRATGRRLGDHGGHGRRANATVAFRRVPATWLLAIGHGRGLLVGLRIVSHDCRAGLLTRAPANSPPLS